MRKTKPSIPKHIVVAQVFGPLYALLRDLNSGEVNEVEGTVVLNKNPAMPEIKNLLMSAPKYIRIWCAAFNNIAFVSKSKLNTSALLKIADILEDDQPEIREAEIREALAELNAMKYMWLNNPSTLIHSGLALLSNDASLIT